MIPKILVTLALTAAQMLLTATRTIEGPRLKDLTATTADYGTPTPNGFGLTQSNGPCFWTEPLTEKKRKRKTKSGKYKEWTYFGTWASMIADHPIGRLKEIHFDEHKVYDADGGGTSFGDDGSGTLDDIHGHPVAFVDLIRIYTGTEDQDPDPRMLATVEAEEGPGTCPAYRGVSYVVFEDVPLEKIGNRRPQIRFVYEGIGGDPAPTFHLSDQYREDFDYQGFFALEPSPNGRYIVSNVFRSLTILDRNDETLISGIDPDSINSWKSMTVENDGHVWAQMSGFGAELYDLGVFFANEATPTIAFDPTDVTPGVSTGVGNTLKSFTMPDSSRRLIWEVDTGAPTSDVVVYNPGTDSGSIVTNPDGTLGFLTSFQDSFGDIFVAQMGSFPATSIAFQRVASGGLGGSGAPDYHVVTGLPSTVYGPLEIAFVSGGLFLSWNGGIDLYLLDPVTYAVTTHRTWAASPNLNGMNNKLPPTATSFWLHGPNTNDSSDWSDVSRIDANDLSTLDTRDFQGDWPVGDAPVGLPVLYSWYGAAALVSQDDSDSNFAPIERYLPASADGPLSLATIVRYFSNLVGLEDGLHYDADLLESIPVTGYSWTQGSARQGFENLLQLYDVDARPHGFLTQFLPRGTAPSVTIDSGDFVGRFKADDLADDTELPFRINLNFADADADLQPNSAMFDRLDGATDSNREQTLDMSTWTADADEAQQQIDRYGRRLWFPRQKVEGDLPSIYLGFEPGDTASLNLDGVTIKARMTKLTVSGTLLKTEWEQDDPAIAGVPDTNGASADGIPPSVIFSPGVSLGEVLDIPLISDAHDQGSPFVYVAGWPEDATSSYVGTEFAQSDTGDDDTYIESWASTGSDGASAGTIAAPLTNTMSQVMDNKTTLTVVLQNGSLSSVTLDELLASDAVNLFAYGAQGRWMLGQFKTATLTAPMTYALTGLILGSRGTEALVGTQQANDRFIMMDTTAIRVTLGASELGDEDWYIPNTPGATPDPANEFAVDFDGNANRPYSPSHGTITDVAGGFEINAIRRTRIGGATLNGTDVPLGETSEAWSADILDGMGNPVRTINGTSLPLTYTDTDAVLDFGSVPTTPPDVDLYQVNPTLSLRGFPLRIEG